VYNSRCTADKLQVELALAGQLHLACTCVSGLWRAVKSKEKVMSENRIDSNDTMEQMCEKLAGGVPGATVCLAKIIKQGAIIDPDAGLMGIFNALMILDMLGIYEGDIWGLYNDTCGQDLVKTLAILRAWQLDLISDTTIKTAVRNRGRGIDPDDLLSKVREELPDFGKQGT
jgi:hypothetical protein